MARQRMIKPEFWTDEKIIELSFKTRLFFIGLWNFADDFGIIANNPKMLKAKIFPADEIKLEEIEKITDELIQIELLFSYESAGKKYLFIINWKKHQTINRPQNSTLPLPDLRPEIRPEIQGDEKTTKKEPENHTGGSINNYYSNNKTNSVNNHGSISEQSLPKLSKTKLSKTKLNKNTCVGKNIPTADKYRFEIFTRLLKIGVKNRLPNAIINPAKWDRHWSKIAKNKTDNEIVELIYWTQQEDNLFEVQSPRSLYEKLSKIEAYRKKENIRTAHSRASPPSWLTGSRMARDNSGELKKPAWLTEEQWQKELEKYGKGEMLWKN